VFQISSPLQVAQEEWAMWEEQQRGWALDWLLVVWQPRLCVIKIILGMEV